MDCQRYDVNNVQVQMVMVIRLQTLRRESGADLTYRNIEEYVNEVLWKDQTPATLNEAADEILHITGSDIVRFLSKKAVSESGKEKLSDFSDLIGGN